MKAIHCICRHEGKRPQNFFDIEPKKGIYKSGWWDVSPQEAARLIDGWIYLHESSSRKSYFAGIIRSFESDPASGTKRLAFVVAKQAGIDGQVWRGEIASQSSYHRIVDADYVHETRDREASEP